MKFILINGRTPRVESFCALCFEPIGETYLREIANPLFVLRSPLLSVPSHAMVPTRDPPFPSRTACKPTFTAT
jgi:hypothetical protein